MHPPEWPHAPAEEIIAVAIGVADEVADAVVDKETDAIRTNAHTAKWMLRLWYYRKTSGIIQDHSIPNTNS